MSGVANLALVLAAIAIVPSAGAFTSAIFASAIAAILGLIAIGFGHKRRGILTIYLALSAAVVSPVAINVQQTEIWLIVLTTIGGLLGLILLRDHKLGSTSTERTD